MDKHRLSQFFIIYNVVRSIPVHLAVFFCWVKKIRDMKGTFHAKLGSIKDRNGMDLKEAEDIKKRWQEYTELYKKRSSQPR